MLQNQKIDQLNCGVLGHCVPLLVHPYHAWTSEIEIITLGIQDLPASQHQFLDDTNFPILKHSVLKLSMMSFITQL